MDIGDFPDSYHSGISLEKWDESVLPIGVVVGEERIKSVEYADMDNHIDDHLTNDKLRKNRPQTWMARLVALLLTSVGGVNARAEYLKGSSKALPDVIKQMSLHDAGFVIMQGHIANFGKELEGIRKECPACGSNNLFTLDLKMLRIIDHLKDVNKPISILLDQGLKYTKEAQAKVADFGKSFNYFEFRIPTVSDAMAMEKWYRPNAIMSFNQKIASRCVSKIENRESDFPEAEGEEMSSEGRTILGQDILEYIKGGKDRAKLRRELNQMPRIWLSQEAECNNCNEFYPVEAPYENLFPLV